MKYSKIVKGQIIYLKDSKQKAVVLDKLNTNNTVVMLKDGQVITVINEVIKGLSILERIIKFIINTFKRSRND